MKSVRHAMILQLIESSDIETQEELAEELKQHGVNVTQATVSRDIKEMRLFKVLTEGGGYKYASTNHSEREVNSRLIRIFSESVLSVEAADNLIVIKTLSASANAAAEAIDSLHWKGIVGTLAGDNTIFVAVQSKDQVEDIITRFRELMKR